MLVEIHQVHGKLRTDGDRWFYLVEFQVTADGADGVWNEGVDWAEIGRPLRRDFLEMLATDAVQDLELELTEEGDAVTRSPEFSIAWTGQDFAARQVVHELGFGRAGEATP